MRNWRINLFFVFAIIFGAAIIGRLIYLQIFQGPRWKAYAQGQKKFSAEFSGKRGSVFLSGGQVLATSVKKFSLHACPKCIEKKEEAANFIAKNFGLDKELILSILKKDTDSELIKDDISEDDQKLVENSGITGLDSTQSTMVRKYPQKEMASQVIGFLGGEGVGQYGIEGFYNDVLEPKDSFAEDRDLLPSQELNSGSDIYLTIEYNIQRKAEEILSQAKKDFNIKSGLIVVMEPSTGKILALANYPFFDANKYYEVQDYKVFQNSAIQQLYEPGSVFKAITMASALNEGKVTPETTYSDTGLIKIGGLTISNFHNAKYGQETMTQVLEKSINTGAVFAQRQVGNDSFMDYIKRFGFFEPTGVDLYGEIFSENKELKTGREINYATASFGQGIDVNPLQMLRAFGIIANGGKSVKPYITEKIVENENVKAVKPESSNNQIISEETARKLTGMLISVVEGGSARFAKIQEYEVAGKTGTAQMPFSALGLNKKGYSEETWQTFIGYAPAYSPRFVALVKFDSPEAKTSEYSVAPAFGKLADYIINYLGIPPEK